MPRVQLNRRCFLLLSFLAALCFPSSTLAQDQDDVVRVETNLVIVNVTVTDKDGHYVTKLKLSDFKIFEDAREVHPPFIKSSSVRKPQFARLFLWIPLEAWRADFRWH